MDRIVLGVLTKILMDITDLSVKMRIITKGEISIKTVITRGETSIKTVTIRVEISIKMAISREEILIKVGILIKEEIIIQEEWQDLLNGTEARVQAIENLVEIVDYPTREIDVMHQIKIVIIVTGKVISNVCVELDISIIDRGTLDTITKNFLIEIIGRIKIT